MRGHNQGTFLSELFSTFISIAKHYIIEWLHQFLIIEAQINFMNLLILKFVTGFTQNFAKKFRFLEKPSTLQVTLENFIILTDFEYFHASEVSLTVTNSL